MLEMALEFEKLKPPKSAGDNDSVTAQLLFATKIAKNFLDFNRDHKSRVGISRSLSQIVFLI